MLLLECFLPLLEQRPTERMKKSVEYSSTVTTLKDNNDDVM